MKQGDWAEGIVHAQHRDLISLCCQVNAVCCIPELLFKYSVHSPELQFVFEQTTIKYIIYRPSPKAILIT